jgi:blocked-early-in-transport protein 1
LTSLIGDEIRDSTSFAEKMNDQFENSRNQLRGTMNRMLRMAQKTGVGWKVWVAFFGVVCLLFWWVWVGRR